MTRQDLAPAEGQRQAQAIKRGHIGQPGITKMRPGYGVQATHTGKPTPILPAWARAITQGRIIMQQHLMAHVFRHKQRGCRLQQLRAAHRDVVKAKHSVQVVARNMTSPWGVRASARVNRSNRGTPMDSSSSVIWWLTRCWYDRQLQCRIFKAEMTRRCFKRA